MQPTIKPPRLEIGATIGIVAPSNALLPAREEHYRRSVEALQRLGFRTKESAQLRGLHWWSAGAPAQIAAAIHEQFADPEVRAIATTAGGATAMLVADLLDYDLIRRSPKPFIGMSDITTYQWAMWARSGLAGFHGNCLTAGWSEWFAAHPEPYQRAIETSYLRLLTEAAPLGPLPELTSWEAWREGRAEGMLIGGLLRRFADLAGTRYFPPLEAFDGAILFWEEVDRSLPDIALNLAKLRSLGVLDRIGGMVVGKVALPPESVAPHHPSLREVVVELTGGAGGCPILAGVDFGHGISMLPMPIGVAARLDSGAHLLDVVERATEG